MKNRIVLALLQAAIPQLLGLLTPEVVKKALDKALDVIEAAAVDSENKIDDAIVLPLCKTVRAALNIPDDDKDQAGDETRVGHA